jgi:hypothetical protein
MSAACAAPARPSRRRGRSQPPASGTRASVRMSTRAAPARSRTRAHSERVAPVVRTSSTRTTRRPATLPAWLGVGAAAAHQQVGADLDARRPADGQRQQRRLVVAAPDQPPVMQGHRGQHVRFRQQFRPRPRHPGPEGDGREGPVAVLQPQDQASAGLVIGEDAARPAPDGRIGDAGAAQDLPLAAGAGAGSVRRQLEGVPAPRAPGRRQEGQPGPAARAQRALRIDHGAAAEAARRQQEVERRPGETAQMETETVRGRGHGRSCHAIALPSTPPLPAGLASGEPAPISAPCPIQTS